MEGGLMNPAIDILKQKARQFKDEANAKKQRGYFNEANEYYVRADCYADAARIVEKASKDEL